MVQGHLVGLAEAEAGASRIGEELLVWSPMSTKGKYQEPEQG